MQPRLSTFSNRLQTLPDKLDSKLDFLSDRLQTLPSKLNTARSGSTVSSSPTDSGPPTPFLPPPQPHSPSYDRGLAQLAERILYRSEGPDPVSGGPLLILCAAAFPDPQDVDYNKLLPYVLSNIPSERELGVGGYSVVFFAGSGGGGMVKEGRPGWAWALQAYGLLGRAVRKKIKRLWVVHERAWVRVILELMAGVVSGKFRRKIVHGMSTRWKAIGALLTKTSVDAHGSGKDDGYHGGYDPARGISSQPEVGDGYHTAEFPASAHVWRCAVP